MGRSYSPSSTSKRQKERSERKKRRERRSRERELGGERKLTRKLTRDVEREERSKRTRSRSHSRNREERLRRRSRSTRSRSRSRELRDQPSTSSSSAYQQRVSKSRRAEYSEADFVGKSPEEIELMKTMGFSDFDSTKNKKVEGNDVGEVHVILKRKYRQYMNRKGGFNRPLDFVA